MATHGENVSKLVIPVIVLWAISTASFLLRVAAIRIRKRGWKPHDYLTALALVCLTCYSIVVIIGVVAGAYGENITTAPMDKLVISLKVFFASEWFFITAVAAFRLAIICLYLELFRNAWFYWCSIATLLVVVLYWIASILTITLLCRPINSNWNPMVKGTCGDVKKTEFASAGFNLVVDLLVVTLPMPIVWSLQMADKKKMGVTAAFLLGLITAGINIGRIVQTKLCEPSNTTYCALDASILISAEITSGILVSCAPTLGPLLLRNRAHGYVERSSRKVPTIGSSGRKWQQRKLQSTTLLNSQDEYYELDKSGVLMETQITSPASRHFGNQPHGQANSRYSAGILVENEMRVSDSAAPAGQATPGHVQSW